MISFAKGDFCVGDEPETSAGDYKIFCPLVDWPDEYESSPSVLLSLEICIISFIRLYEWAEFVKSLGQLSLLASHYSGMVIRLLSSWVPGFYLKYRGANIQVQQDMTKLSIFSVLPWTIAQWRSNFLFIKRLESSKLHLSLVSVF